MRTSIFKFHDGDDIEGRTTVTTDAREQARREERLRIAMRGPWAEIPRADLSIGRFQTEDTRTGELYETLRGEISEFSPIFAYYIDESGSAVFLERPAGPRTVDELAAQRAARDQTAAARRRPRVRS